MHCAPRTPRTRSLALLATGLLAGGLVPLTSAAADNPASVASVIVPVDPQRILDTRQAIGVPTTTPLSADQTITLQVSGVAGIPVDATGVVLNVTVNGASGAGYVSAYPTGGSRPNASVINYTAGEDVANMVTAILGPSGAIELYNAQSSAHLIADVAGYLVPGSGAVPGPQGPQGPPGPAARAEIVVDASMPVPGFGANEDVAGTAGTVTLRLRCLDSAQGALAFDSTGGTTKLLGSELQFGGAATAVFVADELATGGTITRSYGGLAHLTGTLSTPDGGLHRVDISYGREATQCKFAGTITPA
jgi:hypothetical protein